MLSACKSNFYSMKSNIRFYYIFIAFIFCLSLFKENMFSFGLLYLILISISMNLALESSSVSGLSGILLSSPIPRKNIVMGRYLFLLLTVIPLMLLLCIARFIKLNLPLTDSVKLILLISALVICLISFYTPLIYLLGAKYSGIFIPVSLIIPLLFVFAADSLTSRFDINIDIEAMLDNIQKIYDSLPAVSGIFGISLVFLAVSIAVSTAIFKKKEF